MLSTVGKDASHAAWLRVQHADADAAWQLRALRLMEPLAQMREASRSNYAYLYDRIMLKLAGNSVMQRSSADARPAMPSGRCGRWRMTIRSISTRRAPRWDWNRSPTIARDRKSTRLNSSH